MCVCLMVLPSHLLLMMGVYFRNESISEDRGHCSVSNASSYAVFGTWKKIALWNRTSWGRKPHRKSMQNPRKIHEKSAYLENISRIVKNPHKVRVSRNSLDRIKKPRIYEICTSRGRVSWGHPVQSWGPRISVGSPSCFVSHVVPSIGGGRGELAAGEIYCQSPLIRALMHELELLREQPVELLGRAARWR